MKRIFYKIANPVRNFYRFIFRPETFGVKILIECDEKFLLIRNSYGVDHWTFPGGGVKKRESPENAVKREVNEEVGVEINPVVLGQYFNTRHYTKDTVYCFYAKVDSFDFRIDESEVTEAKWFSEPEIPQFRSAAVEEVLNLYKSLTNH